MSRIAFALFVVFACVISIARQVFAETTVVWISIDGFRGDYLGRIKPPTLSRLAAEGASTAQERPIFPSLTFPNHIAQATGTTVDHDGIPMNSFYDPELGRSFSFPDDQSLLRAEPIWVTAKRQGVRVAVIDWPMSHGQSGPWTSDYHEAHFDSRETDQLRLDHVIDVLNKDRGEKPLRLVMSYVSHIDTMGHRFGPDSPEVQSAVMDLDGTLDKFVTATKHWFDSTRAADDELYMLFTTDHGMRLVTTYINLDRLIGSDLLDKAKIVTSGPIASIYLNQVPADQRAQRISQIVEKLKPNAFLQAWAAKDVPPEYHYSDPTRIGEIVVLLSPGYSYTEQRIAVTRPSNVAEGHGMHGFDPAVCPEMYGGAIVWRYRHPLVGHDLGPIDNTQWHATVAKLLGIEPSAASNPKAIALP